MTPLPVLLAELFGFTARVAAAPTEQAADVLRVQRHRVSAEIAARCSHG